MSISISKVENNKLIESNITNANGSNEFSVIFNEILSNITEKEDNNLLENLYSIKDFINTTTNEPFFEEKELLNNILENYVNLFHPNIKYGKENLLVNSTQSNNNIESIKININKSIMIFDILKNNLNDINTSSFDSNKNIQIDLLNNLEKNITLNDLKLMINNIVNKYESQPNIKEGITNYFNTGETIPIQDKFELQNLNKKDFNDKCINTNNFKDDTLDKLDDVVSQLNKFNFISISENNFKVPIEQQDIFISNPQQIVKLTLNKIRDAINNNITELKIHLKPKELGEVLIKLTFNDGVIEGKIVANKTVTDILQTNIDTLKNDIKNTVNNIKDFNLDLMSEDNSHNHGNGQNNSKNNKNSKPNKTFESYFRDTKEI